MMNRGIDNFVVTPTNPDGPAGTALRIASYSRNASQGEWQWSSDGSNWNNIADVANAGQSVVINADDEIRFQPALNFNGTPPSLSVSLVDSSADIVYSSGALLNVSNRGGSTPYSSDLVVLSHAVDPINDVPTLSITGTQATYEENSNSLTLLMANALVSDVDSSQYSGGSLSIALNTYIEGDILDISSTDVEG